MLKNDDEPRLVDVEDEENIQNEILKKEKPKAERMQGQILAKDQPKVDKVKKGRVEKKNSDQLKEKYSSNKENFKE